MLVQPNLTTFCVFIFLGNDEDSLSLLSPEDSLPELQALVNSVVTPSDSCGGEKKQQCDI